MNLLFRFNMKRPAKEMGDNMKIILSRKGFDSSTGGFPSPIIVDNGDLEDGKLLSLPIPVPVTEKQKKKNEKGISYNKLRYNGISLSTIIQQLTNGRFTYKQAHLDPDLCEERFINREDKKNWQPVFGQQNGAQTYLENRDVREGDLFLFFGWFRQAKADNNGELKYVRGAKKLHVIFGWLQIDKLIEVKKDQSIDEFERWLHYHPHIVNRKIYPKNTIYKATRRLTLDGLSDKKGGGIFSCFKQSLQLTAPEEKAMSHWSLPKWLCENFIEGIWQCRDGHLPFDSDGRRQEFVFDVTEQNKQKAIDWLKEMF